MRLLDGEIVDRVSEKVLAFSALLGFGFDNELTVAARLIGEISRGQACFVVTEIYRVGITVFGFMCDLVVHSSALEAGCR